MLQIPQKGQPIDVSLMYKIVEEINNMDRKINRSSYSTLSSSDGSTTTESVKTSEAKIITVLKEFTSLTQDTVSTQTVAFPGNNFSKPPIVTVTPMLGLANIKITNITVSGVTFSITPLESVASLKLNIIAIGKSA
jgi:hypothetical protein